MTIFFTVALGAVVAMSQSTQTTPQTMPPREPIDKGAFGRVEAILNYCAKVDSTSSGKYKDRIKLITQDQPGTAVDEARKSKEYQDAFDSIGDLLEKNPPGPDAAKSCKAFLDGK